MSADPGIEAEYARDQIKELTAALRKLAIIPTMARGVQQVVHNGHRCRICLTTWSLKQGERHTDDYVLKGTER